MMVEFLLDENLSAKLCTPLSVLGQITHVSHHLLLNADDNAIWHFAAEHNYIIITKDNDYFHKSRLLGCPPKVIKVSCGNKTTAFIGDLLVSSADTITAFVHGDKCYMEIVH